MKVLIARQMRWPARVKPSVSFEDQITANEKQIRAETAKSADRETSDDEAKRLLAHAESLRVTNSLARGADRSVEPAVEVLDAGSEEGWTKPERRSVKLRKEWMPVWLERPAGVSTRHKDADVLAILCAPMRKGVQRCAIRMAEQQIKAIAAYLWQDSFDGKLPAAAARRCRSRQRTL